MKESTPHNPIMLAYMIFIFFCVIWHFVCRMTGSNFEMWNKIIIAVTVASYFFSLNSINRRIVKINEETKQLLYEQRDLLKGMIEDISTNEAILTEDLKEIQSKLPNKLDACEKELKKSISSLLKRKKFVLFIDVIGYLVFFMILGINGFSRLFVNITDTVTLLAFLIALLVDYMENIFDARSEEHINNIKCGQRDLLEWQNKAESI